KVTDYLPTDRGVRIEQPLHDRLPGLPGLRFRRRGRHLAAVGAKRDRRGSGVLLPSRRSAAGAGRVQRHGRANKRLQCLLVDLVALVEVDGTPGVALEAGVEEAGWILECGPLGKGHLHDVLVGLAGTDQSVVRPHWNPSPLPLLDDFGIGFLDQGTEPAEHHAAPVAELPDSRVYQLRSRFGLLRPALLHGRLLPLDPT